MSSQSIEYTINLETGKQIMFGGPTWKRLATTYYTVGDTFTDQTIPETNIHPSQGKQRSPLIRFKCTTDPMGEKKFIIVGSTTWNKRFIE